MTRRLIAAAVAALFIFSAIAAPAPAGASTPQTPVAAEPFDTLTVRFTYNTAVGTAVSDDGKTRQITLRPGQDAETALAAWEQAPGVLGVVPNMLAEPLVDPVDPNYAAQWDLHEPTAGKEGASNVSPTWGTTTGTGAVVAVIDTGRTNHPDLLANMPDGWGVDMIENELISGDTPGRDTDPTDEGDWTPSRSSTWHGTHVAGTIGAVQNSIGVSGIAPNATIMHVRVLGHGGGSFLDVIDGIRWAAGLTTSWDGQSWSAYGLPNNAHPADVINMSLGGIGACFEALQTAISAAHAAGTVVVTAAGNDFRDAGNFTPANCNDTVTVGAVGRAGGLAFYSNFGNTVDISAPGGDMTRDSGILSTIATGATTLTGYSYTNYQGTSMAAPHVAGVAALVAGLHPTWSTDEIEAAIYAGVRTFPADTVRPCVTNAETPTGVQHRCGAGLLDAVGALNMAQPTLTITAPARLAVGETATVSATSDLPGAVTLAVASGSASICTLSSTTLSTQATGTCTLNAATAATADHVSATATLDITVTGTPQIISFGVGPLLTDSAVPFGTTPPTLTATASSGLPVSYESRTPSVCETTAHDGISDAWHLRLLNVGTCTLLATQSGNAVYERATSVERSFSIVQGSQTISLGVLSDRAFDPTIAQVLPRFSSAGLPLNYAGLTSSVCEPRFNGSSFTLNIFTPGMCTIRAEQGGTTTYLPAETVTRTIEIFKLTQVPLILDVGGAYQSVNSSTGYGVGGGSTTAPFIVTSVTPSVCTVGSRIVSYRAVGTCILQGTKAGDDWHYAATVTLRITVFAPAKITQGASIVQIGRVVYGNHGTWVGSPTPSFTYQWFSCTTVRRTICGAIRGATSENLIVTSALAGKYAYLRVGMVQAGYERAWVSSNVIKLSAR